jgi:hypothetical protein
MAKGMVDIIMDDIRAGEIGPVLDVRDVVAEVANPTGEGTFEGSETKPGHGRLVYYSYLMPKGSEFAQNVSYDPEAYDMLSDALQGGTKLTSKAQDYLKGIGYYDGEIDGLRGKKTVGAINRYLLNFSGQETLDWLKGFFRDSNVMRQKVQYNQKQNQNQGQGQKKY